MSNDKPESLSETWNARFDDRDDEELAVHVWAQRLAARERAMAQPIRNFTLPGEGPARADLRQAANDDKPQA
ncbi:MULTISPECIES: hypothetical protein [Ramlibacter]|uniref:Uncharacterized protein n=1 Tax=Ramlibacter aquaticus TaxID=2780094 RepID=A0ABR9S9H2_9BURK|nr:MULTISPECIES: hypothetical protein [Ramlibacter]MBE7938995.1 hypothetical protein [Ramlibacter aquaticus]